MAELTKQDIAYQRLYRNGLLNAFNSPIDSISALVGIQSQLQQYAEVSIWNRCGNKITTLELAESYKRHEIINIWSQRCTLHMCTGDDWDILCDVYNSRSWGKKYDELFPAEYDFLQKWIHDECHQKREIHKKDLLRAISAKRPSSLSENDYFEGFFIRSCCLNGLIFGQPDKPSIKTFIPYKKVRKDKWSSDEKRALKSTENMMLRYFNSYGPATLADFCHWSGLPTGQSKQAFKNIIEKLDMFSFDKKEYYTQKGSFYNNIPQDNLFLLGKFDPLFVSYKHKDWIASEKQAKGIWQSAARVEAVVLEGIEILGTWRHTIKGKKMMLRVIPFDKIKTDSRKKIALKAEQIASFWDKELDAVVYE